MQIIEMMKKYAEDNNVPIIEEEGLNVIIDFLKPLSPKTILEIGSAIGYSASMLNQELDCNIVTVERNEKMYKMADMFINELQKNDRIKLIYSDALDPKLEFFEKFDVIYIDAAKGQNIKFFNKYKEYLTPNGVMIFDNLLFHGYVYKEQEEIKSKDLRQLVRKIKEFHVFIKNQNDFEFKLIEKGDGIGICKKK